MTNYTTSSSVDDVGGPRPLGPAFAGSLNERLMSSDGSKLRDSWLEALENAQTRLGGLLASSSVSGKSVSQRWRFVATKSRELLNGSALPASSDTPVDARTALTNVLQGKGKGRSRAQPEFNDVVVHRRSTREGEVIRAMLDVELAPGASDPATGALISLDAWKAILATPELRKEYDPYVQDGKVLELIDSQTRISKTDFVLGWPANPRDAVTISRTHVDSTTLIDVCTSLPRSPDEPGYLRPAPPFVRSHVHLYAWCIQIIQSNDAEASAKPSGPRIRVSCFWQHDLKAIWGMGDSIQLHLPSMLVGIVRTVQSLGPRMTVLRGYGLGVGILHLDVQASRQLLTLEYMITGKDHDDSPCTPCPGIQSVDDQSLKEYRRLERSTEFILHSLQSWDVRVHTKSSSQSLLPPHWLIQASQPTGVFASPFDEPFTLRISHPTPPDHSVLKVVLSIEPSASLGADGRTIRINGIVQTVHTIEPRDFALAPSFPSSAGSRQLLEEASTVASLLSTGGATSASPSSTPDRAQSINSVLSDKTEQTASGGLAASSRGGRPGILGVRSVRSPGAEKAVGNLVRRNYIYFTSLLQEPEAKWSKPITEARGVTVTQLNSIDPTLVVYKAEAVFVGIGVWDLLSIVATPGVASYWNKGYEDAVYLEHVSELSGLWHIKTRAAWPVNARDSVQMKTTYKSPTACHVFSFSTDDTTLFPVIPLPEPGTIRTQVDLQGWAIEALSPNTTLLTLLDQSDPKGWSNKSSIPSQMIAAVAGMGDFSIRVGGPPMPTRIMGAKFVRSRYDQEKSIFRLDYETSPSPSSLSNSAASDAVNSTPSELEVRTTAENVIHMQASPNESTPVPTHMELPSVGDEASISSGLSATSPMSVPSTSSVVECELRCDLDTWALSLDVIVDPAPQNVTCLKRHKLANGGGLWLTIEHDAARIADECVALVIRKGGSSSKDKGSVIVNGVKIRVDIEDLPEHEVKTLAKQKRIKPTRIPLDQPPVHTILRRRGTEDDSTNPTIKAGEAKGWVAYAAPLSRWFSSAATQVASTRVTAPASSALMVSDIAHVPLPDSPPPMHTAFEALARVRELHSQSISDGWALVSEKNIAVYRKYDPRISSKIAIHKGQLVIEGYGAEDIAAIVSSTSSRMYWDDRTDSVLRLDSYGSGCETSFVVTKAGFPFRDRGFYVASLNGRVTPTSGSSPQNVVVSRVRTKSTTSPEGRGRSPTRRSKPSTIICVSTSYATTTPSRYSHPKINPFNLPIGQVLVEGWVLETLDPYTSENLSIPSTRCTLISAIDLAGSVPFAYSMSHNVNNIRSILSLERYIKGRAPPPYSIIPAPSLTLDNTEDEDLSTSDGQLLSWHLSQPDEFHTLLSAIYSPEDNTYRAALVLNVQKPKLANAESAPPFSTSASAPDSDRPSTPSRSLAPSQPNTSAREFDNDTRSSTNSQSLSRSTTAFPPPRSHTLSTSFILWSPSQLTLQDNKPHDAVVCEIVIDAALYKTGCIVQLASQILAAENSLPFDQFLTDPTESPLPFQSIVCPLPSSALNSSSSKRYLLIITLPTAQYFDPSIHDPLTGKATNPPPKPEWLFTLEEYGALVNVLIKPAAGRKFGVMVGESTVYPAGSGYSPPKGRLLLPEPRWSEVWPHLRRVPFDPDLSTVMEKPFQSASHLFEDLSPLASTAMEDSTISRTDSVDLHASPTFAPPRDVTLVAPPIAPGLLGFLGQYRFPSNISGPASFWPPTNSFPVPGRWLSRQPSLASIDTRTGPTAPSEPKPSPSVDDGAPAAPIATLAPPLGMSFSLRLVMFLVVIAFLAGSLFRSMLSPADFWLVEGHPGRGVREWKEILRLVHLHAFGRGLVIGVVREVPL